jgi:GYF domain 2
MAPGTEERILIDDPRLDGGEWLFRRDGQVFGPVDSRGLASMLYRGQLDPGTPVSSGDGAWRPVGEVPIFLVHAKRARAALEVEREITGAKRLRERRGRVGVALGIVALLLLLVAASVGGFLLARRRASTSPLLEDFGAGIRIASAARVGVSHRAPLEDEVEVEVPLDPAAPGGGAAVPRRERAMRQATPAARASGAVDGGELVAAQYDERRIQTVVAREQRTLAPCFRDEAARSPEFQGDVPIEFAIANDGRVASLWIDEPRLRAGPLKDCLQRALSGWRFDPFPGQRPTVSLAFRIGR